MRFNITGKKPEEGKSIYELDTITESIDAEDYNEAFVKYKELNPEHIIIMHKKNE